MKTQFKRLGVWVRRFGPLILVLGVAGAALSSGLTEHLSLHELRERRGLLTALVQAHPMACLAAYVALYAVAISLSLPVALVLTLTGGLLFGPWIGGAAAAIGCTLGSSGIFLICRTAFGDLLRGRAGSMVDRVEAGVRANAFSYVVAVRLIPVAPLWLVNLALGFVDIPLRTFFVATLVGIAPVSVIYAGLGAGLNRLFASGRRLDRHAFLQPGVIWPLVGLAALALIPPIVRTLRARSAKTGD